MMIVFSSAAIRTYALTFWTMCPAGQPELVSPRFAQGLSLPLSAFYFVHPHCAPHLSTNVVLCAFYAEAGGCAQGLKVLSVLYVVRLTIAPFVHWQNVLIVDPGKCYSRRTYS